MVIIEADDVYGTALEQMVVGVGFVATGSDGARLVVFLHQLCQVLRQQGVHAELAILGQRRSVVPGIQDEVRLFKRQRVSLGRRPLLQHFVTD